MSRTSASSATRATAATPFRRTSGTRIRLAACRRVRRDELRIRHPDAANGSTDLLQDPYTPYLEKDDNIRVQATSALPATGLGSSIQTTEDTYSLMMSISKGLGVNCNFCHNTREFGQWSESTPQRVTAWYGIRLVRNLNNEYLDPLKDVFPATRLGPLGNFPKLNCATCHQGASKPLLGVSLAKDYPELGGAPSP